MSRNFVQPLLLSFVLFTIGLGSLPLLSAEETTREIQGEVVDPAAYLRESRRGPEATDQTYEAVDGGQTLALLEEGTGSLYLLLAEGPGEDPSASVYDYANQSVKITGTVLERGGLKGIVVKSVEPLKTPEAQTEPATPPVSGAPATP